jgi:hypothetical protein
MVSGTTRVMLDEKKTRATRSVAEAWAVALVMAAILLVCSTSRADAAPSASTGYWIATAQGGVFGFGPGSSPIGSPAASGVRLSAPIAALASTLDGKGYWLVGADGGVLTYGDAAYFGSVPGSGGSPSAPIVGLATTTDGGGYWLAGSDGSVSRFGDATFFGSALTAGIVTGQPFVGIATSPDGKGYWLAGADGGVFTFGNQPFFGSLPEQLSQGGVSISSPVSVVGLAAIP